MNIKQSLMISLGCFLLAMLLAMGRVQASRESLAARIAPSVLRFHILANSDSGEDQQVKLQVRSLILDYVRDHLSPDDGKKETISYLKEHRGDIEQTASRFLARAGFPYRAQLQLTKCYFPTRAYGDLVFPCGYYDAARVILGDGAGHNWWCVLYPRFCFADAACTGVPEASMQLLRDNINQGDFLAMEDRRPDVQIRFFIFPFLNPSRTVLDDPAAAPAPPGSGSDKPAAVPDSPNSGSLDQAANPD